jgi:hypothetical protein
MVKNSEVMEWKKLIVYVYSEAMDPGIVHQDCTTTELLPEELKVGERVRYKDPSGIMASLTVKAMDENGVTLQVGKMKEVRLWPGEVQEVDKDGRDYTNFYLHVKLEPSYDEDTLLAPGEELDDDGRYDAWA